MSASANKIYRPETRLVQSGTLRSSFGETSEALFLTQGYVYDTAAQAEARFKGEDPGYQYSRFANPTIDMFERRMAAFEGAEAARATATGMAAVTLSLVGQVKAGDHVIASKAMFGSCRYVVEDYLPRFGVTSTLVDGCNLDSWRNAVRPNTKTFFLESPTNPALEVIDIAAVAEIAHDAGATLVVDNVFATPLFQSPLALGCRLRRLFGDQAHRRTGTLPRRRHSRLAKIHHGQDPRAASPDRAVDVAVQCLGPAQEP